MYLSLSLNEHKLAIALLCIPEFELFVGGISGNGAVEDNIRTYARTLYIAH